MCKTYSNWNWQFQRIVVLLNVTENNKCVEGIFYKCYFALEYRILYHVLDPRLVQWNVLKLNMMKIWYMVVTHMWFSGLWHCVDFSLYSVTAQKSTFQNVTTVRISHSTVIHPHYKRICKLVLDQKVSEYKFYISLYFMS